MTDNEHALMIMMFTRQTMYIQMLIDMLKSNEIIQGQDVPAFDFAVCNDPGSVDALHRVNNQYPRIRQPIGSGATKISTIPRVTKPAAIA
jgi:hypothetical protein